ncbi:hypothetical protein Dimus_012342 [Dionaea muscipula]
MAASGGRCPPKHANRRSAVARPRTRLVARTLGAPAIGRDGGSADLVPKSSSGRASRVVEHGLVVELIAKTRHMTTLPSQ